MAQPEARLFIRNRFGGREIISILLNLSIGALGSKAVPCVGDVLPWTLHCQQWEKWHQKLVRFCLQGSLLGIPGESSYILEHIISNFPNNIHKLLHWWVHSTYLLWVGGCVNFGWCGPGLWLSAVKTFRLTRAWGGKGLFQLTGDSPPLRKARAGSLDRNWCVFCGTLLTGSFPDSNSCYLSLPLIKKEQASKR